MIEDQNDILDSRIKLHDRHRFEIKLDIDLDASLKTKIALFCNVEKEAVITAKAFDIQ